MVICSIILRDVSETSLPAGDTVVMTLAWRLPIVVRTPARERIVCLDATGGSVSCTDLREECRSWNPRTPVASIARTDDSAIGAAATGVRVPKGKVRERLWDVDYGTSFGSGLRPILVSFSDLMEEGLNRTFMKHSPPTLFGSPALLMKNCESVITLRRNEYCEAHR